MKKKVCFVLIAALAIVGCRQQEQQEENAASFETMTVSKQDITLEQSYPAQIEGRQSVKIIPRVEGYLRQICVKEGQRVKKGQVLFVIDQATYQAEVKAAEANVAVAKAGVETAQLNYDSRKTLYQKDVVSDYDLRTATANLSMAKPSRSRLRHSCSRHVPTCRTPFSAALPTAWWAVCHSVLATSLVPRHKAV